MMAPCDALYGGRCRSPGSLFEVVEATFIWDDSIHDAMEKMQLIIYILR